jgi:signal peptidase I
MSEQARKRLKKIWVEYIRPIAFVVIVLTAFRSSVADWNDVPTGSMKPTILEGDRIFVNKLAYDLKVPYTTWRIFKWSEPTRGDVVVFFSPKDGIRLVKRVVGVPGDVIESSDGKLTINGTPLEYAEPVAGYAEQLTAREQLEHEFVTEVLGEVRHPVMRQRSSMGNARDFRQELKDGEFWMMGDNRDNSGDSRVFGPVSRDRIVGRASRVMLSLDPSNSYKPRWGRFFKGLP